MNSLTEFQQGKENTIMKRLAWLVSPAGRFPPLASEQDRDQEHGLRLNIGDEIYFKSRYAQQPAGGFRPGYALLIA